MKNIINEIIKQAAKIEDKNFAQFIEIFYSQNLARDFFHYDVTELYNSAFVSFNFFKQKKAGEVKIQTYNPTLKSDGFESSYTFLNIVNDDMPFLVDSVVAYLDRNGVKIKNIMHPIYSVKRDDAGNLKALTDSDDSRSESVIQLHLEKIISKYDMELLEKNIKKILDHVSLVVKDWQAMVNLAKVARSNIDNAKTENLQEIKDFISWIADDNFIMLGAQEFDIVKVKNNEYMLQPVANSGFGIFRSTDESFRPQVINNSFGEVVDSVKNPYVIEILKSRYRSSIHRNTNAERIRIQKISEKGEVIGEYRFIGLFTSSAYHAPVNSIPLVRNKIAKVIADSGYKKGSHNYKDLVSILESYPHDELFQINPQDLLKNATGIVAICGRSQVRFFAREDKFKRFVSCLIFTPREKTNSDLREKIKNYLAEIYQGELADSFVQITDSNLIRFHVIIRTNNGIPQVDETKVESEIEKITRDWSDDLREAIRAKFSDEESTKFFAKYKNAFSISYMDRFDPKRAAIDITRIEDCLVSNSVLFNLYKSSDSFPDDVCELKIYSPKKKLELSSIMPILESFGFNVIQEHTYTVNIKTDGELKDAVWIHYFYLNLSKSGDKFLERTKLNFEKAISLVWDQTMQVGFLNRLLVAAGFNWKQVYLVRAYSKYLYQTGFKYDQEYVANVLVKYNKLTKLLVELFETKFDPFLKVSDLKRENAINIVLEKIKEGLSEIKDINDDTVIRKFFGAIKATLRTNYYQTNKDTGFKGYLSFKFNCKEVPDLPLPLPYAEIFVYSNRVEAIHLRGGKVARGGLRWSDRQEDFRTEILGLMKAQMTKNAVIVPVGSKGGFVLKRDLTGMNRDEIQKEGIECYKTFLRGLLDITDNVINGKIQHPQNVVMYDDVDPYLVVAADKGTATFSDIANSVSAEYNFWLGDAFASGGSVGYDHKKMGITAKGGWISVMRHFREMGIDTQRQDFTCVGIGDLAGDVFGNGMLLSRHIKLLAAFNHIHIFLDPNPDTEKSFIERERMFNLPRSSWVDYDKSLISQGGGIFERSAKSIPLSAEIKAALDIAEDELAPNDLIKAILKAPVDLLWNGGIGTYVKAFDESNLEVGDRANDALRINGNELRCKVVGEGGNLGFTQRGRIEYALAGGRINTDAMDNSAGVDCSDHEVNIKIALTQALRANKINMDERNKILESMTDEVASLVLNDNLLQTQAISVASSQGISALGDQSKFLDDLEKSGLLNRKIEFLPSKQNIEKRLVDRIPLTRPELCVMLSYAKMNIYNHLLNSKLVEDKYFENELFSYFPKVMQKQFVEEIKSHQLRKEIIATQITNFVVNRVGITFVNQICQDSGFNVVDVVRSLIIACDSFRLREAWDEIEKLDGKIPANIQAQMFLSSTKLLERSVLWMLRNQTKGALTPIVTRFRKIADELSNVLSNVLAQASRESFERKIERYCLNNVDRKLASKIASFDPVASAFDIAEISAESNLSLEVIAKIYFAVGTRFSLKWLRTKVSNLSFDDYWHKLSSKTILEDLYSYQMRIAKRIVQYSCSSSADGKFCELDSVEKSIESMGFLVERFDNFITDLKAHPTPDMSVFIVALNRLKPLVS